MAVEGGMKCVKYLVFIFNFLFWICGCALIGLGIYVLVQVYRPQIFQNASVSGAPIVIIAVGVVIFFISFFGCCGAAKENYCMVTTFAVLLVLVFLVEIAAAIAGYVYRNQIQNAFTDSIKEDLQKYNTTEMRKAIDDMQRDLQCCGAKNYTDWYDVDPYKDKLHLPASCCNVSSADCGRNLANVYQDGCVGKIESVLRKNIGIVAGVALGIAFFEILGIVFSCCLMKGIRSGYEVM